MLRSKYKTHKQKDANSFVFVIKNKEDKLRGRSLHNFISKFWLPYKSVSSAKIVFSFYSYTVFLCASLLSCSTLYELLLICFVNKLGRYREESFCLPIEVLRMGYISDISVWPAAMFEGSNVQWRLGKIAFHIADKLRRQLTRQG